MDFNIASALYASLRVLIAVVTTIILVKLVKKNKNLYEKLTKYFHIDLIFFIAIMLIISVIRDYFLLKETKIGTDLVIVSIILAITLIVDFLIKKYWKPKVK